MPLACALDDGRGAGPEPDGKQTRNASTCTVTDCDNPALILNSETDLSSRTRDVDINK